MYGRLSDHHHPHAEGHERDPDEDQDAGHALTRWRILGNSYRRQCMLQTRRGLRRNERLVLLILGGERWLVVGHAVNYHGYQEGGKGCRGTKGSVAGFTRNVAAPAGPFSARAEYGGAVRLTVVCRSAATHYGSLSQGGRHRQRAPKIATLICWARVRLCPVRPLGGLLVCDSKTASEREIIMGRG